MNLSSVKDFECCAINCYSM